MKLRCNVISVALLAASAANSQRPILDPEQVSTSICWEKLQNHIMSLSDYSKFSPKNPTGYRAMGTAGFQQTVDHVVRGIQRCGKDATHRLQKVGFVSEKFNGIALEGPDGLPVAVSTVKFNTASGLNGVSGNLVATSVGCYEDQWRGIEAHKRITIIRGGQCNITDKVKLAKQHGASAVLLYDQPTNSSLNPEDANRLIPTGIIDLEVAEKWIEQLAKTSLNVELNVDVSIKHDEEAINVIANTTTGSPDDVIMIGARLDSPGGPGLNDNASGVSALIEMLEAIHFYTGYKRQLRFAWWGGINGPAEYLARLPESDVSKIRLYLDVNTVASHNPNFTIFSYDDADKVLAGSTLAEFLTENQGVNVTYREPDSKSALAAFRKRRIPSCGITTGADECKGLPCDGSTNFNPDALQVATSAVAFTISRLALA